MHLGGEEWQLGIVISSFAILPLLFRPFMGRWTAAVGPRKAGMVAGLLFTAAILLHVPIASIWLLIPVRMLNGAAMALAIIAGFLAVANLAPESRRGEGMAFANIAVNAGGIWTPYLGLLPVGFDQFRMGIHRICGNELRHGAVRRRHFDRPGGNTAAE